MNAKITSTKWINEFTTKAGHVLQCHEVCYDGKKAFYNSKSKDQKKFVAGQDAEFTEEERTGKKGKFLTIKPVSKTGFSPFVKEQKREHAKYSGFSASYVKDMLKDGILKPEQTEGDVEHNDVVMMTWKNRSMEVFEHMVNLDKTNQ